MNEMPSIYNTTIGDNHYAFRDTGDSASWLRIGNSDSSIRNLDLSSVTAQAVSTNQKQVQVEDDEVSESKRLVRVLVVDPDELVPVSDSVLHDGKEQLTDLTDEELFFEIDLRDALEKHNARRTMIRDKDVKDREEFLEPVRIRDLSMFVVTIAKF